MCIILYLITIHTMFADINIIISIGILNARARVETKVETII